MEADLQMRARRVSLLGRAVPVGPIATSVRAQRALRDAMLAQNVNGAFGGVVLDRAEAAYKAAAHATSASKNASFRQPK